MSLADEIIYGREPDFEAYLRAGNALDDIDEYGFTPLIECAITERLDVMQELIKRGININKPDVTGNTALHWAVDHNNLEMVTFLLKNGANPNAYTLAGL